ncbi:MAG: M24 family metallopeptidase, partial [Bacillota bacterium]
MSTSRLERLRASLVQRGLDAIVVNKPHNRFYLSGFTGSAGVLLITETKAYLITDFRYTEQAAAQAPAFEVLKPDTTNLALLGRLLEENQVQRLGFEGNFLTVDEHVGYRDALGQRELISASGLVESLRLVKDEDERNIMRRAAAIADEAWAQMIPLIKPGVVERDLAVELEYRMKKLGAEGLAFDIIVASGVRSALPHGRASEKLIESGDLVTFDFGAIYKGYCSDMTRTVMVGEPTEKQREIYETVLEAEKRGVAACKPGMTGKELDEVCRSYIREKGYAEAFGHGTGHGVGIDVHEGPRVSMRGEQDLLEPGMIVTIEPGIYLPGWGGVR